MFRRTWWQRWRWSRVKRRAYHSRLGWWLRNRLSGFELVCPAVSIGEDGYFLPGRELEQQRVGPWELERDMQKIAALVQGGAR